jgi:hypothetical protein
LFKSPILATNLPNDDDFKYVHRPVQGQSTIPLSLRAFDFITTAVGYPGLSISGQAAVWDEERDLPLLDLASGILELERRLKNATPEQRKYIHLRIERGPAGKNVKRMRGGKCQICEHLGKDPIAFRNARGEPYAEAHHVIPVGTRQVGSLSHVNIMVLCPNHHRQAHFGVFPIVAHAESCWTVEIDGKRLRIEKPMLPTI